MATTAPDQQDLRKLCQQVAQRAQKAAAQLARLTPAVKNQWLLRSAELLRQNHSQVLQANALDLEAAPGFGLTKAQTDRLRLTPQRIESIAQALEQVALLPDPVGEVIDAQVRPNGLQVARVRVPLGVVFFIYESRPNVTADAAALCVKSGNAVILRGGKEAVHSSRAIVELMQQAAQETGLPEHSFQLLGTQDREAVGHLLRMEEYISLVIPRGGPGLIRRVVQESTVPVMKHYAGNCHVYVDAHADVEKAVAIVVNAKCQRPGVCNAAESVLVHRQVAKEFWAKAGPELLSRGVEIRADEATRALVPQAKPASEEDYFTEFLDLILAAKIVDSLQEAIDHINHYGSHHTDAIVTEHLGHARAFTTAVDSAAVIVNASTRFNDGGEFGLGAEIGISTDKFHARGPCGLRELTTYKWIVYGDGQVRQ